MRLTYDPRHNIAYIRFGKKQGDVETIKVSEELCIDLSPDGKVYGIELLNANQQLQREELGKLFVKNGATGEESEVPLSVDQNTLSTTAASAKNLRVSRPEKRQLPGF